MPIYVKDVSEVVSRGHWQASHQDALILAVEDAYQLGRLVAHERYGGVASTCKKEAGSERRVALIIPSSLHPFWLLDNGTMLWHILFKWEGNTTNRTTVAKEDACTVTLE